LKASRATLVLFSLALAGCVAKRLGPPTAQAAARPLAAALPTPTLTPALSYPQARPLDNHAPVKVRADHLRYNNTLKETRFLGHVVAVQDTTILHADSLISADQGTSAKAQGHVRLEDSVRKVELSSDEGEYKDSLGEASLEGGVVLHSQDPYAVPVTVTGRSAWYRSLSRLADLKGGVRVWRGNLSATAEEADVCGDEDRVALSGGVDLNLGKNNHVSSKQASMDGKGKNLVFEGDVRASLIPAEIREASAHPEK
jgi:lipopolysaccharide export system protein LptA